MSEIKQVGPGRKTIGTIDGITYYVLNGKTYARSAPIMPASVYNTPEAKLRQAIFKMVQMHTRYHLRTIRQTYGTKGNGSPSNRYISANYKALSKALKELAQLYCAGEDVTIDDVEAAISTYAAAHPKSITIGHLSGYQDVWLTGEWPATITLNALAGDSTVIIIVNEHGEQTTINADGTVTTSDSTTNDTNGSNTGSGDNGSGSNEPNTGGGGNDSGGGDNSGGGNGSGGDNGGSGGDDDNGDMD